MSTEIYEHHSDSDTTPGGIVVTTYSDGDTEIRAPYVKLSPDERRKFARALDPDTYLEHEVWGASLREKTVQLTEATREIARLRAAAAEVGPDEGPVEAAPKGGRPSAAAARLLTDEQRAAADALAVNEPAECGIPPEPVHFMHKGGDTLCGETTDAKVTGLRARVTCPVCLTEASVMGGGPEWGEVVPRTKAGLEQKARLYERLPEIQRAAVAHAVGLVSGRHPTPTWVEVEAGRSEDDTLLAAEYRGFHLFVWERYSAWTAGFTDSPGGPEWTRDGYADRAAAQRAVVSIVDSLTPEPPAAPLPGPEDGGALRSAARAYASAWEDYDPTKPETSTRLRTNWDRLAFAARTYAAPEPAPAAATPLPPEPKRTELQRRARRLATLRRRQEHLATIGLMNSYERAEESALRWALSELEVPAAAAPLEPGPFAPLHEPAFVHTDEYGDTLTIRRFPECWSFFVDPGDAEEDTETVAVKVPNAEVAKLARVLAPAATAPLTALSVAAMQAQGPVMVPEPTGQPYMVPATAFSNPGVDYSTNYSRAAAPQGAGPAWDEPTLTMLAEAALAVLDARGLLRKTSEREHLGAVEGLHDAFRLDLRTTAATGAPQGGPAKGVYGVGLYSDNADRESARKEQEHANDGQEREQQHAQQRRSDRGRRDALHGEVAQRQGDAGRQGSRERADAGDWLHLGSARVGPPPDGWSEVRPLVLERRGFLAPSFGERVELVEGHVRARWWDTNEAGIRELDPPIEPVAWLLAIAASPPHGEPADWKTKAAAWLRESDEAGDTAHTAFVCDAVEHEAAWERVDDVLAALADKLAPQPPHGERPKPWTAADEARVERLQDEWASGMVEPATLAAPVIDTRPAQNPRPAHVPKTDDPVVVVELADGYYSDHDAARRWMAKTSGSSSRCVATPPPTTPSPDWSRSSTRAGRTRTTSRGATGAPTSTRSATSLRASHEPYHMVDAFGSNTTCGVSWRDVPVTLIRRLATCPACWTAYRLRLPTVQVMDGETGEGDAGQGLRWVYIAGPNTWFPAEMEGVESGYLSLPGCPAPTPRAP